MCEILKSFWTKADFPNNYILMIGGAIFAGIVAAWFVKKFHIPQIIGYVAVGVILGPVLGFIPQATVQSLELFSMVALGLVGFLVGGELKRDIFVKFGRQVPIVLLFEGCTAFLLVGVFTFFAMWHFSDWQRALAVGVVFAAICSATDPASTIAVLWEYKSRGPLTSMLTAIVTLDDALALVLYAISIGVAGVITGHQEAGFIRALFGTFYEILGALALGFIAAILLSWQLSKMGKSEKILPFVISVVLMILGAAIWLKMDVILAAMALGATLVNLKPYIAQAVLEVVHKFFAPLYILFFVLVGARVSFANIDWKIGLLVVAYVAGSIGGKTLGAYLGGVYAHTVRTIRKYLGFCLYPQGGIAVALLIIAGHKFPSDISGVMLLVVVIGAFCLQMIGPIGVKYGAGKAGELGLNVTEEDLIRRYKVSNMMTVDVPVIAAGASLSDVLKTVSSTDHLCYCVVDDSRNIIGVITLDDIRNILAGGEQNDWLVALDIAEPVTDVVTADTTLSEAIELMEHDKIEYVPVVVSQQSGEYAGVLDSRAMSRQLSAEVLSKQQEADRMYARRTA